MLEKPDLADERIMACLEEEYGLHTVQIDFLPLGADQNTAVYHAHAENDTAYFVKLRRGAFDESAVVLPRFLYEQGVRQVIAPLPTRRNGLWADLGDYRLILYPFVEGCNGYDVGLSERQWIELGAALKEIQSLNVPPALERRIRRESFSPRWRDEVRGFMARIEREAYTDPLAVELAAFLKAHRSQVGDLVRRADRLGEVLQAGTAGFVLCHSDLHAGNLLMEAGGKLYIVDWDEPILAPPERDLMCAGSGIMGNWRSPYEEEQLFYQGYGSLQVDRRALAYYRYERIIMDIAEFCKQLLLSEEGGADREQALRWLQSNFEPGGTIAIARRADPCDSKP